MCKYFTLAAISLITFICNSWEYEDAVVLFCARLKNDNVGFQTSFKDVVASMTILRLSQILTLVDDGHTLRIGYRQELSVAVFKVKKLVALLCFVYAMLYLSPFRMVIVSHGASL